MEIELLDIEIEKSKNELREMERAQVSTKNMLTSMKCWIKKGQNEIDYAAKLLPIQVSEQRIKDLAAEKEETDKEYEKYMMEINN